MSTSNPSRPLRSLITHLIPFLILLLLFLFINPTTAYIPAIPVNDTTALNLTDASSLLLRYAPNGVYGVDVSSQLTADVPTGGIDMGAIVHFSESSQGPNLTTSTPWIAFISCDKNETASDYWDIFTLVRDRGAVAALLYTLTAEACLLNPEYINNFEKPVDVFATKSKSTAGLIENQFPNTNQTYWAYNGTLLNESGAIVNESLDASYIPTKTFLIATLTARNSSGSIASSPTQSASPTSSSSSTPKGKSLAMIVLYCITGIVCTLFLIVIVTGAIRALRHPERYGPRATEGEGRPVQTSVQGIGQAILDTFPVIKFTRRSNNEPERRIAMPYPTYDKGYELAGIDSTVVRGQGSGGISHPDGTAVNAVGSESTMSPRHTRRNGSTIQPFTDSRGSKRGSIQESERESFHSAQEVIPPSRSSINSGSLPMTSVPPPGPEIAAAARALAAHRSSKRRSGGGREGTLDGSSEDIEHTETEGNEEAEACPICLLEFEDGDDVRVLPCQQAHSYHQACIDPWLLEVSPSCPLCRRDFSGVAPITSESQQGESSAMGRNRTASDAAHSIDGVPISLHVESAASTPARSGGGHRFGRYLAFVRRERRRTADVAVEDGEQELGGGALSLGSAATDRRRRRLDEQHGPGPY